MSYLSDFYQGLRDVLVLALPELSTTAAGGGIWRALELNRQDFKAIIDAGRLPFSTINFTPLPGARGHYGGSARVYVYSVEISYTLASSSTVDVEAMDERLQVLADYLWSNRRLGGGQIMQEPYVSDDLGLAANVYFAAARWPYFAGAVILPEVCLARTV